MRLRYFTVRYQFGGSPSTLERHYRELRDSMLNPTQRYALMQPGTPWRPAMDIHETPDSVYVKIELAGMRDEDIDVILYSDALIVTGVRADEHEHDESACYHEAQIRYGPFRAVALLPAPIDSNAAEARYEQGMLRVTLPKVAPSRIPMTSPTESQVPAGQEHGESASRAGDTTAGRQPSSRRSLPQGAS